MLKNNRGDMMSTIDMKDEALKLALEALETCEVAWPGTRFKSIYFAEDEVNAAITAIKQALAAPVQQSRSDVEPVAWMSKHDVGFIKSEFGATPTVPLYTTQTNVATPLAAPAPEERKRQWSDIDIDNLSVLAGFDPSHKVELGLVRSVVRTILRKEKNT
jgi:hypothetical protein